MKPAIALVWMIALVEPAVAGNTSVDSAFAFCAYSDSTGLTSAPCEVSGWKSTVTVTLDMSSSEARKFCASLSLLESKLSLRFDRGWTLLIKSPYSNGNSIAYCPL